VLKRARTVRKLLGERRAATAVEFALVALPLFLVSFGAVELGLILWTRNALQAIAADAARCGAIQSSDCTGSNTMADFVLYNANEGPKWLLGTVLSSTSSPLTVNVNSDVNTRTCPTITVGTVTYETVEITTSFFAGGWLPPPFGNYTIDVCASSVVWPTSAQN
jgi:Flp pilus assembly protein TadG